MYVHRGRSRREETFGIVLRRVCHNNFLNTIFFIIILILLIIFLPEKGWIEPSNGGYERLATDEASQFKLRGEVEDSSEASFRSESSPYSSDVEWEEGMGGFVINDFEESTTTEGIANITDKKNSALLNLSSEKKTDVKTGENSECNLFEGEWVRDTQGALYSASTCPYISSFVDCKSNGRPDDDYESWRWNPHGSDCFLPRFNASLFFQLMRNKTIAFVGDTLARNQMESLLCLLSQIEKPVNKGNKRLSRYIFRSNQMVLMRLWSAWLLHADAEPLRNRTSPGFRNVHLDVVDKNWGDILPNVHVLVLCSGHWWARPAAFLLNGNVVGGEKWWLGSEPKQLTNLQAFELGLRTVFRYLAHAKDYKGITVFRTISPVHYSLNSDSTTKCEESTLVSGKSTSSLKSILRLFQSQLAVFQEEAAGKSTSNGSKFLLLNITSGSAQRSDGHPGFYGNSNAKSSGLNEPKGGTVASNLKQDCVNWCLPGPIDTWNEIMLPLLQSQISD